METKQQKYQKDYYQKKKEEKAIYYKDNKIKILENNKKWHINNPEYKKIKDNKKYIEDPESRKSYWNNQKKELNKKRRDFVENYKIYKCCIKCNDNRHYLLDFHHIQPENKKFNLGDATKYSIKKIEEEIKKCILLCRNCHSEFHYLEKQNNISIKDYLK